jgi:hypothetical protein
MERMNYLPRIAFLTALVLLPLSATAATPAATETQQNEDKAFFTDARSFINASIGTQLGVQRTTQFDSVPTSEFVSELEVQLKIFRVLALALSYNPGAAPVEEETLSFSSRLRLTGKLHFLPLEALSMYLTAGLGAQDFDGLVDFAGDNTSYHGGLGAEIFIGNHVAFTAEYAMVVPGVRSIQDTVVTQALDAASVDGSSAINIDDFAVDDLDPTSFIDPANFQVTAGLRYYF